VLVEASLVVPVLGARAAHLDRAASGDRAGPPRPGFSWLLACETDEPVPDDPAELLPDAPEPLPPPPIEATVRILAAIPALYLSQPDTSRQQRLPFLYPHARSLSQATDEHCVARSPTSQHLSDVNETSAPTLRWTHRPNRVRREPEPPMAATSRTQP
jgi:hypothetical protein